MPQGLIMRVDLENSEPCSSQRNALATTSLSDRNPPAAADRLETDGDTASKIRAEDRGSDPGCVRPSAGAEFAWRSRICSNKRPEHSPEKNMEISERAVEPPEATPDVSRDRKRMHDAHGSVRTMLPPKYMGCLERCEERVFTEQSMQNIASRLESVSISSKSCSSKGVRKKTSRIGEASHEQDLESSLQPVSISSKYCSPKGALMKTSWIGETSVEQTMQDIESWPQPVSISSKSPSSDDALMKTSWIGEESADQTAQDIESCPQPLSISSKYPSSEGALMKTSRIGDSWTRPFVFVRCGNLHPRQHQKTPKGKQINNDSVSNTLRNSRPADRNSSFVTQCDACGRRFPYSECEVCKKLFLLRRPLQRHSRNLDRGENCFACSVCSRMFSNASNWRMHATVAHSNEKSYDCAVCSKTFFLRSSLQSHALTHKELKTLDVKKMERNRT